MLSKYFLVYLTLVSFATSLAIADHNSMQESSSGSRPTEEAPREIAMELDAASASEVNEAFGELQDRVFNMGMDLQVKKNRKTDRYSTGERSTDEPQ